MEIQTKPKVIASGLKAKLLIQAHGPEGGCQFNKWNDFCIWAISDNPKLKRVFGVVPNRLLTVERHLIDDDDFGLRLRDSAIVQLIHGESFSTELRIIMAGWRE